MFGVSSRTRWRYRFKTSEYFRIISLFVSLLHPATFVHVVSSFSLTPGNFCAYHISLLSHTHARRFSIMLHVTFVYRCSFVDSCQSTKQTVVTRAVKQHRTQALLINLGISEITKIYFLRHLFSGKFLLITIKNEKTKRES